MPFVRVGDRKRGVISRCELCDRKKGFISLCVGGDITVG